MAVYYIGTYDIVDPAEFQKYPPVVMTPAEVRRRIACFGHRCVARRRRSENDERHHPLSLEGGGAGSLQRPRLSGGEADPAAFHRQRQHGAGGSIRRAQRVESIRALSV